MNTFSLITAALAATENDPDKADLDAETREMGRVLHAVQTVVDTLTPAGAGRFVVGFANIQTAGTSLSALRITVSAKPLRDPSLSLVEKAVVIATFAAHEIGHTHVTAPRKALVQAHSDKPGYHAVANIADDIVLEPYMVERFPILQDAFVFTGHWVLRTTSPVLPKVEAIRYGMATTERFNLLISATRYGDIPEIVWADAASLVERDWCRDWATRLLALPVKDHAAYLRLTDEVWEHLRTETQPEPEPEPEPEGGEGEDDPDGEPTDEDGDEEGDEDGEGEPDEDEDGEGESDDEPTIVTDPGFGDEDEDEDEDEPSDDGEPSPDDDGDEPEDDDGGDDDDDSDEDGDDDADGEGDDGDDSDGEDDDEDGGDTGSGDAESDEDDDDDATGDEPTGDSESDAEYDEDEDESDEDEDESDDESEGGDEGGDNAADDDEDEIDSDSDEHDDGGGGNPEATVRDEDDWDNDEVDQTTHDQSEADDSLEAEEAEEAVRKYDSTTVTAFGRHGHYSTEWE